MSVSFPIPTTDKLPTCNHLGFYVLSGFPMDKRLMEYLVEKYEADEENPMPEPVTLFQLHEGVDPQFVHFVHGNIIACLSRDDPLQLRYVHSSDDGMTSFVYCKSSSPATSLSETSVRVVLAFAGEVPYCYVCGSGLCESFKYSASFIKGLSSLPKGCNPALLKLKKDLLVDNHLRSTGHGFVLDYASGPMAPSLLFTLKKQIPGCVLWMMDHFAKNFPPTEY